MISHRKDHPIQTLLFDAFGKAFGIAALLWRGRINLTLSFPEPFKFIRKEQIAIANEILHAVEKTIFEISQIRATRAITSPLI